MPDPVLRAREILRQNRGATDVLIGGRRGLLVRGRDRRAFLRAMKEAFALHFLGCPEYQHRCLQLGFTPDHLRRLNDLWSIPHFFVTVLKHHRFITGPESKIKLTLTSSGTSGQKSAIYLDGKTLKRIHRIVRHIYDDLGMVNRRRTNYLCFTYDPEVAKDVGTAFSDELLTGLTGVARVFYAIRWQDERWQVDRDGVLHHLEAFQKTGKPLRVLGFPAHAWDVLGELVAERGRPFDFGPLSYMITGGGWKTRSGEEIPKDLFRRKLGEWLGMPAENVRDLYGMVEHGVPYCECEHGNMHVPRYSMVAVRDPETLELLPYGKTGIFHFLTPYLNSFPAISLLTTDVGYLEPQCPCGRRSEVLVLQGRGGVSKHKGCALAALDVLDA